MRSAPRFSPGRAVALSRCDSADDYQDELDRQKAEDEARDARDERIAEDREIYDGETP